MASQFKQLPLPNESNSSNFAKIPFAATSGSNNFVKLPLGTNPLPAVVSAYIAAAGITNPAEITAVTNLYNSLVSAGIYSKFDRIYPISPTSLNASAYDLVTAVPLTWFNAPTNSSNGVTLDGATQYGLTDANMNAMTNFSVPFDGNVSVYLVSIPVQSGVRYYYGILDVANTTDVFLRQNVGNSTRTPSIKGTSHAGQTGGVIIGFHSASRYNSNLQQEYLNGTLAINDTTPEAVGTAPAFPMCIGAESSSGTIVAFRMQTLAFFTIGGSLTSTQQASFSTIVNTYQTALGRNVY